MYVCELWVRLTRRYPLLSLLSGCDLLWCASGQIGGLNCVEREGGIQVYGEGKMCWEGEDVWGGREGISKSITGHLDLTLVK